MRAILLGREPSCSFDGFCVYGFGRLVDALDFGSLITFFYVNDKAKNTKEDAYIILKRMCPLLRQNEITLEGTPLEQNFFTWRGP